MPSSHRHLVARVFICATFIASAILSGCYSTADLPSPQQEEYILQLRRLSTEVDRLTRQRGGTDGKLPPRDLEDRIEQKRKEFSGALSATPTAVSWNATIDNLRRSGETIVIHASYKEHWYQLQIQDDKAKRVIEATFASGDNIRFSGPIGPEQSLSPLGASLNPDFHFYPTMIQKGSVVVQIE